MATEEAWVTLATNDTYALGCLVLGQSLRRVQTTRKLHCLITDGVSQGMIEHLWGVFDAVSTVNVLDSGDEENLALIGRPDLGVTFTKLHCWRLLQYRKCVFLDADTLVLQNADELFDHGELAAAPDIGWPDIFNSGVFVFCPSLETYRALLHLAVTEGSFDGGDQGLLNSYFSDWRTKDANFRLSFVYNMSSNAIYSYAAAYQKFAKDIKIVHFLGDIKPWQGTGAAGHAHSYVARWLNIYRSDVLPKLGHELHARNKNRCRCCMSLAPESPNADRKVDFKSVVYEYEITRGSEDSERSSERTWVDWEAVSAPLPIIRPRNRNTAASSERTSVSEEQRELQEAKELAERKEMAARAESVLAELAARQGRKTVRIRALNEEPEVPSAVKYGYYGDDGGDGAKTGNGAERNGEFGSTTSTSSSSSTTTITTEDLVGFVPKLAEEDVKAETQDRWIARSEEALGFVSEGVELDDADHQRMWEAGHVDYLGIDRWENIQKRLDKSTGDEKQGAQD